MYNSPRKQVFGKLVPASQSRVNIGPITSSSYTTRCVDRVAEADAAKPNIQDLIYSTQCYGARDNTLTHKQDQFKMPNAHAPSSYFVFEDGAGGKHSG